MSEFKLFESKEHCISAVAHYISDNRSNYIDDTDFKEYLSQKYNDRDMKILFGNAQALEKQWDCHTEYKKERTINNIVKYLSGMYECREYNSNFIIFPGRENYCITEIAEEIYTKYKWFVNNAGDRG
jgi:hypothetical protein